MLILDQKRHLQIVHVVSVRTIVTTLSTFLYIVESTLQIEGRGWSHLNACCKAYIESRLRRTTVQLVIIGIND